MRQRREDLIVNRPNFSIADSNYAGCITQEPTPVVVVYSHFPVTPLVILLQARLELDISEVHVMQIPQIHWTRAEGLTFQTPEPHVVQTT